MKKFIFLTLIFFNLLLFSHIEAFACSCNQAFAQPLKTRLFISKAVFSGEVIEINKIFQKRYISIVKIKVKESWKGQLSKEVTINTDTYADACGYTFEVGKSYLIFAYTSEGKLTTNSCLRNSEIEKASEELKILGKGKKPQNSHLQEKSANSEAFERLLKIKGVNRTASDITIQLKTTKISARKLSSVNGEANVLSIPIEITNSSAQTISMNLAHEWYGGIWAPTDFYIAALIPNWEREMVWNQRPAYQVGNLDKINKTILKPGKTITIDVRLNWRGTGSVPIEPLIDESKLGKYTIRFLLFFKAGVSEEYFETQNFNVEVVK